MEGVYAKGLTRRGFRRAEVMRRGLREGGSGEGTDEVYETICGYLKVNVCPLLRIRKIIHKGLRVDKGCKGI